MNTHMQLCRYFNQFLMSHNRDVAEQIRSEYVDTMMKIYFSYFKDYCTKLFKLEVSPHDALIRHFMSINGSTTMAVLSVQY